MKNKQIINYTNQIYLKDFGFRVNYFLKAFFSIKKLKNVTFLVNKEAIVPQIHSERK